MEREERTAHYSQLDSMPDMSRTCYVGLVTMHARGVVAVEQECLEGVIVDVFLQGMRGVGRGAARY